MKKKLSLSEIASSAEKSVAKKQRDMHVIQTFSGTLRVETSKVYINKKDGQRALEYLRQLKVAPD